MWEMIPVILCGCLVLVAIEFFGKGNWRMTALKLSVMAVVITLWYFAFTALNFYPAKSALENDRGIRTSMVFGGQSPDLQTPFGESLDDERLVFDGTPYHLPGGELGEMKYSFRVQKSLKLGQRYDLVIEDDVILKISEPSG